MLTFAFLIFAGAVAGGFFMVYKRSSGGVVPPTLPRMHALTAAIGLGVLLIAALRGGSTATWLALIIFAAGFAGGLLLFGVVYRGKRTPGMVIAAHGGLGVTGLLVLGYAAFA